MATRAEVDEVLRILHGGGLAQGSGMSRPDPEIWTMALEDIPGIPLLAIAKDMIKTEQWFPTPAALRKRTMTKIIGGQRQGLEAWGDVKKAVSRFGFYRTPIFEDDITARAVNAIGWQAICSSENEQSERARFADMYDELAAEELQDRCTAALTTEGARDSGNTLKAAPLDVLEGEIVAVSNKLGEK